MWWLIPLVVVISFCAVAISFSVTVAVKIVRRFLTPEKRTDAFLIEYESREKGLKKELLELPFTELKRVSRYGYPLRARYFPAPIPSDKTVVDFHGHNSSGVSQLKYLHIFRQMGYNVLIPDHRFSGESGGKSITFGWFETEDALDWITDLKRQSPAMTFGVYGESMGGAIAIRVAERYDVDFLISYASYDTLLRLFNDHSKNRARFFMPAIALLAYCKTGARLNRIDGAKSIRNVRCPILLMHSFGDTLIPASHEKKLYDAAVNANKDVRQHLFQQSKHTRSWSMYPKEFESEIQNLIRHAESLKNRMSEEAESEPDKTDTETMQDNTDPIG